MFNEEDGRRKTEAMVQGFMFQVPITDYRVQPSVFGLRSSVQKVL